MMGEEFKNLSLEEKFNMLFDAVEKTGEFWDDEAGGLYREKLRIVKKDIELTLNEKNTIKDK